ncbi:MAG: hypothetical protein L0154_07175 [Chloroflexi bacterium]|nr:hypothetical protein [Chloroflexota bacterium]
MTDNQQVDDTIHDIVERIRNYRTQMEELDNRVNDLKDELRQLLESRGENWADNQGYARIVSEGERAYYDAEALDKLIINDPLHYGWLKDYRHTASIQSRIQVK